MQNPHILFHVCVVADDSKTAFSLVRASCPLFLLVKNKNSVFATLFELYGKKDWIYHSFKGNLRALKHMYYNKRCYKRPFYEIWRLTLKNSIYRKQYDVFEWLMDMEENERIKGFLYSSEKMHIFIHGGKMLELMLEKMSDNLQNFNSFFFNNHRIPKETFEKLVQNNIIQINHNLCLSIVQHNRIDFLEVLKDMKLISLSSNIDIFIELSIQTSHIDVLEWLYENYGNEYVYFLRVVEITFSNSCKMYGRDDLSLSFLAWWYYHDESIMNRKLDCGDYMYLRDFLEATEQECLLSVIEFNEKIKSV